MRFLGFAACALLLSASAPTMAADCTRGMMWPYVRAPGDCLTDAEVKAGKTGVYNGPVDTNPDLSAIKPETPAQTGGVVGGTTVSGGRPSVSCSKGWLWPFVRESGDCATEIEKKEGRTVYGNPAVVPVSATTASASAPAGGTGSASTTPSEPACHKGWLWPFVRDPGDCPTDAERKAGTGK